MRYACVLARSARNELRCVSRTCAVTARPAGAGLSAPAARAASPCFSGWTPESRSAFAFQSLRSFQRRLRRLGARRPADGNPKRPRFCGLSGPGSLRSPSPANLADRKSNRRPIFFFEKNRDPRRLLLLSGLLGLPSAARAASGGRGCAPHSTTGRWGGLWRLGPPASNGSPTPRRGLGGLGCTPRPTGRR